MILCVLLVVLAAERKQRRKDVDDDDDDDKDDGNDVAMLDEEKIFNEENVDADNNRRAIICIWQLQKKVLAEVRICMMDILI